MIREIDEVEGDPSVKEKQVASAADPLVAQLQMTCDELHRAIDSINGARGQLVVMERDAQMGHRGNATLVRMSAVDDMNDRLRACSEMHANAIARVGDWVSEHAMRSISERVRTIDDLVVDMHNHIAAARDRRLQNVYLAAAGTIGVAVGAIAVVLSSLLFSPGRETGPMSDRHPPPVTSGFRTHD